MKRHGVRFRMASILIGAFIILFFVFANGKGQQLRPGGFLQLDKRFNVGGDSIGIADFYNRFRMELGGTLNDQLYFFSSVDIRFYDLPRVSDLKQLENLNQQYPTDLSLWEAYIDVYGFLMKNLDLRIGKQRISWGTADKLNPTDNLNPDDFSDLVNFAEKIPTWAIKGDYYLGNFTLTGIWIPSLTPILLPRFGAQLFLGNPAPALRDTLALPSPGLKHSMFAFKVSGNLGTWDYSLSYFNGYDDIPVLYRFSIGNPVGANLYMKFPKMQVIGADFATELAGIGFWGEGALFFPGKVFLKTVIGNTAESSVALDDKPYFKFTIGGDYTFPRGWYFNIQWMHGFFTERGNDFLHDYFIGKLDKNLFNNDVKVSIGGALEIGSWNDISATYGYGIFPELVYQAIDNMELALGAFVAEGKKQALFGAWKNSDQVYLRMKVNF
ncbi:MAG: hypothetical protein GXO77_09545 [Calditrichaeota bacterium]|nr:hypothetical protein [Calditrichota bacterium]